MIIIPHLILKKDEKILLIRRSPSNKIWSSHWHCVTGGIESGESPKEAILREAQEEIGLHIKKIHLGTTVFLIDKDYFNIKNKYYGLELFFVSACESDQVPQISEPSKHDSIGWFDPYDLPSPMIPGVAFGIKSYLNNIRYGEFRNV